MILEAIFALFALLRKCEKSHLFGPSRKVVRNTVVFSLLLGPFPHFGAKVRAELIFDPPGTGVLRTHGEHEVHGGVRG